MRLLLELGAGVVLFGGAGVVVFGVMSLLVRRLWP